MWSEGSLKIQNSLFHYWMKAYKEGSSWGIDGGKISKLLLKRDGKIEAHYDRGWDVEPADSDTKLAVDILLHSNN